MPDWGKMLKEIAEAVAASAIDPRITGRPRPSLGRFVYEWCLDRHRQSSPSQRAVNPSRTEQKRWYRPEYSAAWRRRDATADRFFVHILKFANGAFYAGQTRELRERLSEHRDGRAKTTAGQNPKLVWFGIVKSREAATAMEVELKKLIDSNPREIRRMIISFQDLVKELDYT